MHLGKLKRENKCNAILKIYAVVHPFQHIRLTLKDLHIHKVYPKPGTF